MASWGVWCHCGREEEDSLLTDNESYANPLAATPPYANMAIVEMKGLLHGWPQRAFIVEPRIKTIFILTRWWRTVERKGTAICWRVTQR